MAKKAKQKETGLTWTNTRVRLGDLKPWDDNPRMSSKKQAQAIIESWDEFGQIETIAVSPNLDVYDGHQRLSALLTKYGPDYEVDARQISRLLTDAERRRLTVKKHAGATGSFNWDMLANWDSQMLLRNGLDADYLKQLNTGAAALAEMFRAEAGGDPVDAEPQIDRAEELREKWGTARGQVWTLDAHRLMCGDSTSAEDVGRLMGGDVAELLFTSPPYADMRDYKGGDLSVEGLAQFIPTYKPHARYQVVNLGIKRDGGQVVQYWDTYIAAAREAGYKLLSWNVWDKTYAGGIGDQSAMFSIEHEWLFVFGESAKPLNKTVKTTLGGASHFGAPSRRHKDGRLTKAEHVTWADMKQLATVVAIRSNGSLQQGELDKAHPATFPLALPFAHIEAMTTGGDCVADPFSGSGTTLIACEQLGRKCRAMEISPAYVAVALQRWADATGKTPTL